MEKVPPRRHPLKNRRAFRSALIQWFLKNAKSYPWRQTTDPWAILVSEVMLQQTTIASVIAHQRFEKFLATFPNIHEIAAAPEEKILRAWEGLGYYNRVRNLQKTARAVIENFHGSFPQDPQSLATLPGIGPYTAGALSSFAFNQPAPLIDGNVARVLARLFDDPTPIDSSPGQKILWQRAHDLLDQTHPRLFNSALMELGQTHCSPTQPTCLLCPVRDFCQTSTPNSLPTKKPPRPFLQITEHAFLYLEKNALLLSPGHDSRRRGFWKLPLRSPESCAHLEPLSTHRYTITHHRVTLLLYRQKPPQPDPLEKFHPLDQLDQLPIATPIRKILNRSL